MPATNQQPREKLLSNPPSKLNTQELISVILGTGAKGNSISRLSKELVDYLRSNLTDKITVADLLQFKGIGENKALQIISALELGGRFRANREKLSLYQSGLGQFICGDCLDGMKTLADDSIVLAFTSPPYHNAINYDDHVKKLNGEVGHWERKEQSYDFYKTFLIDRFKEMYRVIKPGGHNVVNISPVAWEGRRVALPFHFVCWMEEIGWRFKEDIVWEKGVVRDKRSGVLMQHPYPGYYYPSLAVEYVFVFQKPAAKKSENNIYHNRSAKEKQENKLDLKGYQEQSKNIWNIRPVAPQENIHPCPFPEELARRVVQYYSYKNDIVLDIFSGSGVTNLVAEKLHRRHIGMETEKQYIKYGVSAIQKLGNCTQLNKKV
ncbi:DNA methyltransferase [Candidatus Spongiihabitans sp.]|uniref:DNA methyltransferase n=1 Tax=Candidatus Spongiihabitans sp. TaxID=3101308 RepID=UPI003C7DB8FE